MLVYAIVCNLLLLGCFIGRDGRRLVICGVEELGPDDYVLSELPHLATSVSILWELPGAVRRVPDPDPLSTGMVLHLRPYILPTGGAGWLSELPSGSLDMV